MNRISVGIILKVDDQAVLHKLENFINRTNGLDIIYLTQSTDKLLYIVNRRNLSKDDSREGTL